ncbi:MAG: serine hydrolase [Candidatus Dormibacter sp.]
MGRLRPGIRALLTYGLALALLVPLGVGAYADPAAAPAIKELRHTSPKPASRPLAVSTPKATPTPTLTTILSPSGFDQLKADLNAMAAQSSAQVGISLQELSGPGRQNLALNGTAAFYAASEYKLPLLMAEAQQVAAGQARPGDVLCYDPSDAEDGWFTDYQPGACFSRADLVTRAGRYSDNTAARILVRYLGGPTALNAYARAAGMTNSALWLPNTTTANDLAAIWVAEALGQLGGAPAQGWLYPVLTHTATESGIPAGLPASATVVHKTGDMYATQADAAYVISGRVRYVLAVGVVGLDEASAWNLIQRISARVWHYEASRPDYPTRVIATPAPVLRDVRH